MRSINCKSNNLTREFASVLACVFAFLLAFALLPGSAWADVRTTDQVKDSTVEALGLTSSDCPSISAERVYVVSSSGVEYFSRNADDQCKIASITKVMTAIVALENFDLDTEITVSENAATIGESSATLEEGDVLTLENALKALMVCSGNDAAQAIAESLGPMLLEQMQEEGRENLPDNGYDAFILAMNDKASELGMSNTLFANPHGLDFDEYEGDFYSSARDVATMCQFAMENETFRSIVSTDETTIPVTRDGATADIALESTDELLGVYEGACGVKTGFTDYAGACFAGACERNGETLYAIVLGSPTEAERFTDCTTLWDWVYDNTIDYPLVNSSETTTYEQDGSYVTVPVVANVSNNAWVDCTFKATISDPDQTVTVFALDGNISQEATFDDVSGDVHIGDKVGTLTFKQHNEVVATVDIVAAEECAGPNFFEGIGVFWDKTFRSFNGQQTEAQSTLVNTTPFITGSNSSWSE